MPQQQKATVRFNAGLVTESGELTWPEAGTKDELNCSLERDGARRRRRGIRYETSHQLSPFVLNTQATFTTGTWRNVGGRSGVDYEVMQVGGRLYFYDKSAAVKSDGIVPTSNSNNTPFSINLADYEVSGTPGAHVSRCQMDSVAGILVVVSESIDPIRVIQNPTNNSFDVSVINIKVRDFEWLGNRDNYSIESPSPTVGRKYDTYNTGWLNSRAANTLSALDSYIASESAWPPLTHPWFSGKNSVESFGAALWKSLYGGTSLIGNGHFILDYFAKDRASASGLPAEDFEDAGLKPIDTLSRRFTTVVSFAGRVFFAGADDKILFTKLVEAPNDLGICYQVNDPTSEITSDLLDTDGGYIIIPDIASPTKLEVLGDSLLVFANNGVWQVRGVDGVFRATEYGVSRITRIGLENPQSFVSVDGTPMWWSDTGIHVLTFDATAQRAVEQNITITTIQTFFERIEERARRKVVAGYDEANKRVFWLYPANGESRENKKSHVLIFDIPLQAFVPWTISDVAGGSSPYVVGVVSYRPYAVGLSETDVNDTDGENVLDGSGNVVTAETYGVFSGDSGVKFIVRDGATGKLTMADFSDRNFLDWGSADYSSFMETGYDFMGDMLLKKTASYIIVYMRTTETAWEGNEPDFPSGALLSAYWDFKTTGGQQQQVYRLKTPPVANGSWDYPETVVSTRLKVRGRGRSLRLRYDSETGKDFILLGHAMVSDNPGRY